MKGMLKSVKAQDHNLNGLKIYAWQLQNKRANTTGIGDKKNPARLKCKKRIKFITNLFFECFLL